MPASNVAYRRNGLLNSSKFKSHDGENEIVDKLKSVGIPAVNGKQTNFRYVDVVAWGCIPVEVKHATLNKVRNDYHFRLLTRHERGIQGDVIILVCIEPDNHRRYYVFPFDHPVFYINGRLKKGMVYTPHPTKPRQSKIVAHVLTRELMAEHENAWHYIEERRLEVISEMLAS